MSRETVQFQAEGSDGQLYTVYASRPSVRPDALPAGGAEDLGTYTPYWTAGGLAVARVEKGRYRVVASGVTLTSADADAP